MQQQQPDPSPDELKKQFFQLLDSLSQVQAVEALIPLLDCARPESPQEAPDPDLLRVLSAKLQLAPAVTMVYLRCPGLIGPMERLRQGEPVRRIRVAYALSENGRCWWRSLLIMGVLWRTGGTVSHVRLVRWLAHRAVAHQIQGALASLRDAGLLETLKLPGKDPLRPVTWHRIAPSAAEMMVLPPSREFASKSQPGPLALALCGTGATPARQGRYSFSDWRD